MLLQWVLNRADALQIYLIEVNTSPALYRHGQVLTDLLPILIEEVVQKVRPTHLPNCYARAVFALAIAVLLNAVQLPCLSLIQYLQSLHQPGTTKY